MIIFCKQTMHTNEECCNLLQRITLCKKRQLGHKDGRLIIDTFHRISMKICIFLYFLVSFCKTTKVSWPCEKRKGYLLQTRNLFVFCDLVFSSAQRYKKQMNIIYRHPIYMTMPCNRQNVSERSDTHGGLILLK